VSLSHSSSTDALLSPKLHKHRQKGKEHVDSSDDLFASVDSESENFDSSQKEKEKKGKKKEHALSSGEMLFLIEGYCTHPPFEGIIIDIRDSLFQSLLTSIPSQTKEEREHSASSLLFWGSKCLLHLLEIKKGDNIITTLSPYSVCFTHSGMIVLASYSVEGEISVGFGISKVDTKGEFVRWRAPELTEGKYPNGNEKTASFSLGMIIYSILSASLPFSNLDCVTVSQRLANGERPELSFLSSCNPLLVGIIQRSWIGLENERASLKEMEEVGDKLLPASEKERVEKPKQSESNDDENGDKQPLLP
jgi:hypothetical protein